MFNNSRQIVQKLWSYCSILRDDGLSYPDYVEQLTYLLFLKMAHEATTSENQILSPVPNGCDWPSLVERSGKDLHDHYGNILKKLGQSDGMLGIIFGGAENKIRDPAKLRLLIVDLIDQRNWSALDIDVKGEAYEGLLEKNAQDTKSGAGQYFTPRPVVDAIVACVRPKLGEVVYDPACGTGGFLIAAYRYLKRTNQALTDAEAQHLRLEAIRGSELVAEVTRLASMNLLLHDIGPKSNESPPPITTQDSLTTVPERKYDVILTNPPFGKRSSVTLVTKRNEAAEEGSLSVLREDIWASTSNKELNFLQHVASILGNNGRAAVVVPDGVLNTSGAGEIIRRRLLSEFQLHTMLRLPTGIFYAAGVNANVLFFDKKDTTARAEDLWVFDLRTNMHFTLVGKPLEASDLNEFIECYKPGDRASRSETWSQQNPGGRWRKFSTEELLSRDRINLDLSWIADEGSRTFRSSAALEELTGQIMVDLKLALEEIAGLGIAR